MRISQIVKFLLPLFLLDLIIYGFIFIKLSHHAPYGLADMIPLLSLVILIPSYGLYPWGSNQKAWFNQLMWISLLVNFLLSFLANVLFATKGIAYSGPGTIIIDLIAGVIISPILSMLLTTLFLPIIILKTKILPKVSFKPEMLLKFSKRNLLALMVNLTFFNILAVLLIASVATGLFFSFIYGTAIFHYHHVIPYFIASGLALLLSFILKAFCHCKSMILFCFTALLTTLLFGLISQTVIFIYFGTFAIGFKENFLMALQVNTTAGLFLLPAWLILALINALIFKIRIKAFTK